MVLTGQFFSDCIESVSGEMSEIPSGIHVLAKPMGAVPLRRLYAFFLILKKEL